MALNGAQLIVKLLERQGIDTIWGIPGGATLPLYDALCHSPIRHILTRHEQGAAFMAQGWARTTGRAAVCTATSGPGATNLITALADAHLDSIPLVAITGQVSTSLIGTDAFQEVDTYGLTIPVTKHNFFVQSAKDLLTIIPEAFRIAESGRPGPVVIDIPRDVQTRMAPVEKYPEPAVPERPQFQDQNQLARMAEMIPLRPAPPFLRGGRGHRIQCSRPCAENSGKRTTSRWFPLSWGLGTMPHDHALYLGMLGMHGTVFANQAMASADLIIALGIRFDDRATGKIEAFCKDASIIHVDVDESEIGKLKNASIGVCADAATVLEGLYPLLAPKRRLPWHQHINALKAKAPTEMDYIDNPAHPAGIIRYIGRRAPENTIVATDVGQAPDVDGPGLSGQASKIPAHVRRPWDHGVWLAGRHGRSLCRP